VRVLIATGGSGGHVFPALTLAREFRRGGDQVVVASDALEEVIRGERFVLERMEALPLRGSWRRALRGLTLLPVDVGRALCLLRRHRPQLVLGTGNSSSGPLVLAARLLGVKTAVCEQNAVLGLTNRLLAPLVDRMFLAFEESGRCISPGRVRVVGNPVREEFFRVGPPQGDFCVLVLGGSQGSRQVNRLVVEAWGLLGKWRTGISVIHQGGPQELELLRERYRRLAMRAWVVSFIPNQPQAYGQAHLVVCRAGSSTLFELAASRRPAILLPYPFATDGHQRRNAEVLARRGAALLLEPPDPTGLAAWVEELYEDEGRRAHMACQIGRFARPRAAQAVVEECRRLVG